MSDYYLKAIEELFDFFKTSLNGLSEESVKERQAKYGFNELPAAKKKSTFLIFLKQFKSVFIYVLIFAALVSLFVGKITDFFIIVFIYVLIFAALVSLFVGKITDFFIIVFIILVNAFIGFFQEYRAETALETLRKSIVYYAKVYRQGRLVKVPMRELVPGDIVFVEQGDKVPADGRLIEVKNLKVDESILTGEAYPVLKETKTFKKKLALGDQRNMVFLGTIVVTGEAKFLVTATGLNSVIGSLAKTLLEIKKTTTHFEKKTHQLAFNLGLVVVIGVLFIFFVGYKLRNFDLFETFMFSLAAMVSGVPEGLPAILTVVLAVAANRLVKKNVIIRHLPAIENLGAVNVVATDKTGTLTQNVMTARKIVLANEKEIEITGEGWRDTGAFFENQKLIEPLRNEKLRKLIEVGVICNNARVLKTESGEFDIIGDSTEAALIILGAKTGFQRNELIEEKIIDEIPFDQELKYRAVLVDHEEHREIYVVGGFEKIINLSQLDDSLKERMILTAEVLAKKAMRVLALACKKVAKNCHKLEVREINNLEFLGLVGIDDPPRPEVKEAIKKAKEAGIRVIMKTGDHKETALAIAKEVGLVGKDEEVLVYTETQLEKLSEKEFDEVVNKVNIFARLTPATKLKIIESLQKQGFLVAMTGDGVNDVFALRKADVGIAMGKRGTDVARESSEIVLVDDNFVSILKAIEEGRVVFNNIRRSSFYLVTTTVAEYFTIISALLLGLPIPLLPIHILWLNLITDGVSGFPLALEKAHGYELSYPPRSPKEGIISKEIFPFMVVIAFLMALVTVTWFSFYYKNFSLERARTIAFVSMAFFQLFNTFNMRSLRQSLFKLGLGSNKYLLFGFFISFILQLLIVEVPFLSRIFYFEPLNFFEWLLIIILSSLVFWFGEIYKFYRYRKKV